MLLVPQVQCLELILVVIHLANSGLLVVVEAVLMVLVELLVEVVVDLWPHHMLVVDLVEILILWEVMV